MDYGQHGDRWVFISRQMTSLLMLADLKDWNSIIFHSFPISRYKRILRFVKRRGTELWWQRWVVEPDIYSFQHCIWCWCVPFWVAIRPIWVICRKIDILWVRFNWTDTTHPYIETNYTRESLDNDCLALSSCWRNGQSYDQYSILPGYSTNCIFSDGGFIRVYGRRRKLNFNVWIYTERNWNRITGHFRYIDNMLWARMNFFDNEIY